MRVFINIFFIKDEANPVQISVLSLLLFSGRGEFETGLLVVVNIKDLNFLLLTFPHKFALDSHIQSWKISIFINTTCGFLLLSKIMKQNNKRSDLIVHA